MHHPYSKTVRRIFFWALVVGFFIITPALILYALGYRYSSDRGVFVFSGSVTIKANPEEISFHLNGKPVPTGKINYLNKSYHIDGLKPGEYTIRVSKEGFREWTKSVTVQSGLSTEFWNVLLPRTEYTALAYAQTDSTQRFFPAPRSTLLALARHTTDESSSSLTISVTDTDKNSSEDIYSGKGVRLTPDTLQNIEWSPREDMLLVPVEILPDPETTPKTALDTKEIQTSISPTEESSPLKRYLLLSLEKTQDAQKFLDEFLPPEWEISGARWSPNERDTIYFIAKNSLWKTKISISEMNEPALVSEGILGYDFYTDHIIALRAENHILYQYTLSTDIDAVQISTTALSEDNSDPHRVVVYDERKIAVINSKKELFLYNFYDGVTYTKQIGSNIHGVQFSNDGKKILFWNDREVFVYFAEKWESQPARAVDTTLQIARFFDPIQNVQWAKDYEHVIYSQGADLKILELDTRGGQAGFTLKALNVKNPQVFMSAGDDKIYFTDEQNGVSPSLFSIDFPEVTGFFGT